MTTQQPITGFYGWTNAWLLFFIYMASAGLVFWGYAVIFPVMIQATGWSRGDASIANSINMLLIGLLVPVAAVIINKIGTRKSIIAGLVVLLSALFLLGAAAGYFSLFTQNANIGKMGKYRIAARIHCPLGG